MHNGLWLATNSYSSLTYKKALESPRKTQEKILADFLRSNRDTHYGKQYGYSGIKNVEDFQKRVPVVNYDDLEPWIERIKKGQQKVLTSDPVLFFELTSGSAGAKKYIPYTRILIRQFRCAISAWMFNLMVSKPELLFGAQYWSISPAGNKHDPVECGLQVGIENDAAYLGLLAKIALRGVLAVPLSVSRIKDMRQWRRETIDRLLTRRDLRFISVWSPSFLTSLIEAYPESIDVRTAWPELKLISCWASGAAQRALPRLKALFPGVEIQAKGLLATEGVVSIPLVGMPAPLLAIKSHFFEFMDDAGVYHLADELDIGKRYRVLITTGSGFARYDLGDMVEVVAPLSIEFVGRASVSDMCGEKLSEAFVSKVMERAGLIEGFSMLVPEWGNPPKYWLLTDNEQYAAKVFAVEKGLMDSFHYSYCRKLGQLGPVEAVYLPDATERYMQSCLESGQRAGDIKPVALCTECGWRARMDRHGKYQAG